MRAGGGGSFTRPGQSHIRGGDGAAFKGGEVLETPDAISGGGGGGFFGGGAGSGGAGGGGSSNLRLLSQARGEEALGSAPPGTGSRFFTSDVGFGGSALRAGGHGRLVLTFRGAPRMPSVSNAAESASPLPASPDTSPTRSSKGRPRLL